MRLLKTIVFTALETAGLALWLALEAAGLGLLGLAVLDGFLYLEHSISYNVANSLSLFNFSKGRWSTRKPNGLLLLTSTVETAIWFVWFMVSRVFGHVVGAVVLSALLIPQHNSEANINGGRRYLYALLRGSITISLIEGMGGQGWLALVDANFRALAVTELFVILYIEHIVRNYQSRSSSAEAT